VKARSAFAALSGGKDGDPFDGARPALDDVLASIRHDMYLDETLIPMVDVDCSYRSSYLLEFSKHGDLNRTRTEHHVTAEQVWVKVNQFLEATRAACQALKIFIEMAVFDEEKEIAVQNEFAQTAVAEAKAKAAPPVETPTAVVAAAAAVGEEAEDWDDSGEDWDASSGDDEAPPPAGPAVVEAPTSAAAKLSSLPPVVASERKCPPAPGLRSERLELLHALMKTLGDDLDATMLEAFSKFEAM